MRFIIEVSENYIKERTNDDYLVQAMKESGGHAISTLVDMISFKTIQKEMEEGKTEFVIKVNPSTLDETPRKAFDQATSMFAASYIISSKC